MEAVVGYREARNRSEILHPLGPLGIFMPGSLVRRRYGKPRESYFLSSIRRRPRARPCSRMLSEAGAST